MNRYRLSTPRAALAAAAVAVAAVNFALLVVLPAQADRAQPDGHVAAARESALPHTDSGRAAVALAGPRGRRHELIARIVTDMQDAGLMRLAGPLTTRSDR